MHIAKTPHYTLSSDEKLSAQARKEMHSTLKKHKVRTIYRTKAQADSAAASIKKRFGFDYKVYEAYSMFF